MSAEIRLFRVSGVARYCFMFTWEVLFCLNHWSGIHCSVHFFPSRVTVWNSTNISILPPFRFSPDSLSFSGQIKKTFPIFHVKIFFSSLNIVLFKRGDVSYFTHTAKHTLMKADFFECFHFFRDKYQNSSGLCWNLVKGLSLDWVTVLELDRGKLWPHNLSPGAFTSKAPYSGNVQEIRMSSKEWRSPQSLC